MNKILWPVLLALTLSACGTTGSKPAAVDDRSGDTVATQTTPAGGGVGMGGGTGVTGSALPGAGRVMTDPRKDPANALSKRSIYFDFDSFVVKDEFRPALEAHASLLKANRGLSVVLQGHADERGSREYNLALGQKRAEAVRKALAVMGVSDAQVEAISFGEEKPRNPGNTEEAYAENRRADVVYADE